MGTAERDGIPAVATDPGLEEDLGARPQSYLFFQGVRLLQLLETVHARSRGGAPEELDELVRFRTRATLEFPATEIYDMSSGDVPNHQGGLRRRWELMVNFMGLTGPTGVLPRHYTEFLVERHLKRRDNRAHAFFDLFSHRAILLFYRAWRKYRYFLDVESGRTDTLQTYLLSTVGMATEALRKSVDRGGIGLEQEALAYYSGPLSRRPRSADALRKVLADYFGAPCRVEEMSGRWLDLSADSATRLGKTNSRLGETTVVGARVWDHRSKLRIVLGPMTRLQYDDLVPGQRGFDSLRATALWVLGPGIDFDVQLILRREDVAPARLGGPEGCRVGYFGWIGVRASNIHTARDGRQFSIWLDTDSCFRRFMNAIGREDLTSGPVVRNSTKHTGRSEDMEGVVGDWAAGVDLEPALDFLKGLRVPAKESESLPAHLRKATKDAAEAVFSVTR